MIECLNGDDDSKTHNYQWFKHFKWQRGLLKLPPNYNNDTSRDDSKAESKDNNDNSEGNLTNSDNNSKKNENWCKDNAKCL